MNYSQMIPIHRFTYYSYSTNVTIQVKIRKDIAHFFTRITCRMP
jgi:hypothetical protein